MNRQSARRPKKISGLERYSGAAAQRAGAFVSENPALVGGSTAFAVAMFFFASNALWYQPNAHRDAFFQTRPLDAYKAPVLPQIHSKLGGGGKEDVFKIVKDVELQADPVVRDIQSALQDMAMYDGSVDGVAGPKTLAAIRAFQKRAGLEPNGKAGAPLLDAIRTASVPAPKLPVSKLKVVKPKAEAQKTPAVEAKSASSDIARIQAALKLHGHDGIEADGIAGTKTRDAIRAFQAKLKMTVTGEPDAALLNIMIKQGWIKS
jgi:peptidoglycan hydrolase-like protein with peptidoglycan-binding domain